MKTLYRQLAIAHKAALFVLVSWTGFSWWAGWPVQGVVPSLALGAGAALVLLVGGRALHRRGRFEAGRTLPLGIVRRRRWGALRPRGLPRHRRFAARIRRGSRTVRTTLALLADRRAPQTLEPQGGPMLKTLATVGWTTLSSLALLMFSQACVVDDPAEPQGARDLDTGVALAGFEDLGESQLMVDLAREIPGFGGVYYEPGGERLVIAMTEASRAEFPAARQAVLSHLAADVSGASMADIPRMDFVERVVEYSFIELARYRARLRPALFGIPEVVSLGVDEEFNRISIGLEDLPARNAVLDAVVELEIPDEILFFSTASPIELHVSSAAAEPPLSTSNTLQGVSPDGRLTGGYQVQAVGNTECTLGFTARTQTRAGTPVFVSNSHCSKRSFKLDRGDWGQPNTATIVGDEIRDPSLRRCWKNATRQSCRESDAALIKTNADTEIAMGEIGRPEKRHSLNGCPHGCLVINSDNPTIQIRGRSHSILDNEELDKVGRATGWTYGDVVKTCEDLKSDTDGKWRLCSDVVDFYSDGGDSGAPVFLYNGDDPAEGEAVLKGIVWGYGNTGSTVSNLGQIRKDLGGLWVYDAGPPIIQQLYGPTVVPPNHMCVWISETWGMYPFHHYWSGVIERFTEESPNLLGVVEETGWLKLEVLDILDRSAKDSLHVTVWDDMPDDLTPAGCVKVGDPPGGL